MTNRLKKRLHTFSSQGGIFMFLRAQLVSQLATWIDNLTAFTLKKTMDFFRIKSLSIFSFGIQSYMVATVIGQIVGGIVICIINYRWTFKAMNVKKKYVVLKFISVWFGSLFLNTLGTYHLTRILLQMPWLTHVLRHADDIFIVAKLFVAIIVGFTWNYNMQRIFVYQDVQITRWLKRNKNNSVNEREINQ
ncbi:CDP-alcohol phosphatidyltransferase [Bacteroidia bacterium]|nr:CDP-alcohol phosphatidyltransferase [Bacteroidia bacterium]